MARMIGAEMFFETLINEGINAVFQAVMCSRCMT
jgi:hypothetical protein